VQRAVVSTRSPICAGVNGRQQSVPIGSSEFSGVAGIAGGPVHKPLQKFDSRARARVMNGPLVVASDVSHQYGCCPLPETKSHLFGHQRSPVATRLRSLRLLGFGNRDVAFQLRSAGRCAQWRRRGRWRRAQAWPDIRKPSTGRTFRISRRYPARSGVR